MDPRTLEQLRTILREERLFDQATPPKWSDGMLARALSEAEREAARTAKLIHEGASGTRTVVPLVEGQREYLLPRAFFEVSSVYYADGTPLDKVHAERLDRDDRGWRTRESTKPRHYFLRLRPDHRIALVLTHLPVDFEDGLSLRFEGYRTPLYELSAAGDEPEIAPHYHEQLLDWACYRAYLIRNPDMYDPVKAQNHLDDFRRSFGPAIDATQYRAQFEDRDWTAVPREF